MVDRALGKTPAHRQPGMPGADDDRGGLAQRIRPEPRRDPGYLTSTATLVGLVTMSNTAERFCDWATSALISSLVASASIS